MKSINPYIGPRERMVLEQLATHGVSDRRVIDAMRTDNVQPDARANAALISAWSLKKQQRMHRRF